MVTSVADAHARIPSLRRAFLPENRRASLERRCRMLLVLAVVAAASRGLADGPIPVAQVDIDGGAHKWSPIIDQYNVTLWASLRAMERNHAYRLLLKVRPQRQPPTTRTGCSSRQAARPRDLVEIASEIRSRSVTCMACAMRAIPSRAHQLL